MNKRSVKKVRPAAKASRAVTSRKAPVRKTSARKASARQATKKADVPSQTSQISIPLNIISTVTVGQTVTVEQVVARASVIRTHKYRVGQTVFYTSSPVSRPGASGSYEVVRLLPSDGEDYQYRIKNPGEAFERVAKESQLELEL